MVNVLKFRTLVPCQKGINANIAGPDQTASKEGSSTLAILTSIL